MRLLEELRSTNLQRQAKKWKIKLSNVRSRLIRPSFYHNAPLFVKKLRRTEKVRDGEDVPPAGETRAVPNHPAQLTVTRHFIRHQSQITYHDLFQLAAQPGAAAESGAASASPAAWAVGVGLGVDVGLPEAVAVAVAVGLAVAVAVGVDVGVAVAVAVGVAVGVGVGVPAGSLKA